MALAAVRNFLLTCETGVTTAERDSSPQEGFLHRHMSPSILTLRTEHAVVDCGAVEAGLKGGPLTLGCDEL